MKHEMNYDVIRDKDAVYARIDDVGKIQDALNDVNYYLLINKLQPIVSPYVIKIDKDGKSCFEIYVDICGETLI